MNSNNFPLLLSTTRNAKQFDAALADIAQGLESGSIRNVIFNDAKGVLSRIAEDAWKRLVKEPFFYAGKWKDQSQTVQDLGDSILIMGLHDVISAAKKVAKSSATGLVADPAMDAMQAFCNEVLPLSLAVASLKDKVVMGRAPGALPKTPENPDKLVKTCPVCFRPIAVVQGRMAHHGYRRPHMGWQTASCHGVQFQPLEVSSEGLQWLIGVLRERLAVAEADFASRDSKSSLLVRKSGRKAGLEEITAASPLWAQHFQAFVLGLESEIASLNRELPKLDLKLAQWAPEA